MLVPLKKNRTLLMYRGPGSNSDPPKMASGTMVDHHSQLAALSDVSFGDWVSIDTELCSRLSPIHSDLAGGLIEITEAEDLFHRQSPRC